MQHSLGRPLPGALNEESALGDLTRAEWGARRTASPQGDLFDQGRAQCPKTCLRSLLSYPIGGESGLRPFSQYRQETVPSAHELQE